MDFTAQNDAITQLLSLLLFGEICSLTNCFNFTEL